MRREVESVVLLLAGGALLRSGLDGSYTRYVRAGMLPFLLATGLVLATVALLELAQTLRPTDAAQQLAGHDHGSTVGWLLAAPVLALLLLAPPPMGSEAAGRSGTALGSAATTSDYPPLPDGDPVRLTVLDFASRAVFDAADSLGQRRVTLTGFVVADRSGTRYLARMVISCCAADARPIKVGLLGNLPRNLPADGWIEVTGRRSDRIARDPINRESIPFLQVDTVSTVPAPAHPYES